MSETKREVKHTHGPWEVKKAVDDGYPEIFDTYLIGVHLSDPEGFSIAEVNSGDDELTKADARLIAAAPELLDALAEALDAMEWVKDKTNAGRLNEAIEQAVAALDKAQGISHATR